MTTNTAFDPEEGYSVTTVNGTSVSITAQRAYIYDQSQNYSVDGGGVRNYNSVMVEMPATLAGTVNMRIGKAPVTAVASDMPLTAGKTYMFSVTAGEDTLAFLNTGGTEVIKVTFGSGVS